MALPTGFDIRNSSGFVTDPSGCFFHNASATSGTTNGLSWTWNDSNVQFTATDIDNSIDARLAGAVYRLTAIPGSFVFTVTLPSAGTYMINIALGQNNNGRTHSFTVDDTITTFINFSSVATLTGQFLDATGTVRSSAAAWATANPVGGGGAGGKACTFATTSAVFTMIPSTVDATVLAHINIASIAATTGEIDAACQGTDLFLPQKQLIKVVPY